MAKKQSSKDRSGAAARGDSANRLRIIGGRHRGRLLVYSGDPRTRPMKERVREAVFNLLADSVAGKHAIDLFAGTGALGLEAISRGATGATLLERHFPTAQLIRANATQLGLDAQVEVIAANAFYWVRKQWKPSQQPLVVFCCPPYDFYVERQSEMLDLIGAFAIRAPAASTLVVECDDRFDVAHLPESIAWDVRRYPPATLAIGDVRTVSPQPHDSAGE